MNTKTVIQPNEYLGLMKREWDSKKSNTALLLALFYLRNHRMSVPSWIHQALGANDTPLNLLIAAQFVTRGSQ